MSQQQKTDFKKITTVIGVLIILLFGIFLLRMRRKPIPEANTSVPVSTSGVVSSIPSAAQKREIPIGQLFLEPESVNVKAGETFSLKIYFQAKGKSVDGVDVVLRFDQSLLEAIEITESDHFSLYPRKEIKEGKVKITAFAPSSNEPLTEKILYATIEFEAKKKGTAEVAFEYQLGETNLSAIVEHQTSKNILGHINETKVFIQ